MIGIASLRCGDPNVRMAIAAGGGPTYANDLMHVACPLCCCQMSQDVTVANGVDPGCEDVWCACHDEALP